MASKFIFPFLFLFMIFSEPIFNCYLSVQNIMVSKGMLQWLYVGIFICTVPIFLSDIRDKIDGYSSERVFFPMTIVLFLYWITQFLYTTEPARLYASHLLAYGVKCIPAAIIGVHFIKYPCMKDIDKQIPFFVLPIGYIIATIGFRHIVMNELLKNSEEASDGGLNYQSISYYMAEFYSYCAYYVFFSSDRNSRTHSYMKLIMFASMFFFAAVCLMSGGRGAMVSIVFVSILIAYMMYKNSRIRRELITATVLSVIVVFAYIFVKFDIAESAGFQRAFENINYDETREILRQKAFQSFSNSPIIGHGIGSIWWEVGFFSHNIFQDILVESGILGLIISFRVIFRMYSRIFKLCLIDTSFLFVMLIFVHEFIHCLFSGYWVSAFPLWLVFGITNVLSKSELNKMCSDRNFV